MTKDVKISSIQMTLMFTGFLLGSTAILNPSAAAYQDAWLANILAFAVGFILISLYSYISILNPGKTLIEILRDNFGKYLGSLISLLYIWYFIHLAALVERDFGEFTVVTTYPETPLVFVIASIVVVVVFVVKKGLEVLARVSEILIPILILIVIFICLITINLYEVNNFLPFLERGLKPVFQAAFTISTFPFGESVIFLMLFPFLNKKKNIFKVSYLSIVITGLVILNITARDLMVLGADMFLRATFPPNITTRLIQDINITPLIGVNLLIGGGTKITVCIYAAAMGITQLFALDDYKPFVTPVAVISVALSIWVFDCVFEMIQWGVEVWPYYSIPFQMVIPLLLLIVSLMRKKINANKD